MEPKLKPLLPKRGPNRYVVLMVVGVALIVMAGIVVALSQIAQPIARRVREQIGTPLPPLVLNEIGGWQGRDRVTVLLLGIDQRPDEDPATARTDTMILLTLDPVAKTAGMLSVPRDLYVPMPGRDQNRINTAHVFGGPEFAMRTVEYNFGIPVNHYVRVNFNALVTLIDLAGGITLYNERDIDDPLFPDANYGYDPFKLAAGWHTLDGATALKYARTRHGDSDFYRIRRQQQVIMALRDKLTSSDVATKLLPNAPAILQTLDSSLSTDLSNVQLVQLALLAKDVPTEKIARVAVDETAVESWTTPNGASVQIPNRNRLGDLRAAFLNQSSAAPTPATGSIAVQNGTQTRGLAARGKAALEAKGLPVAEIGDAPRATPRSVIIDVKGKRQFAERVARELGLPATAVITAIDPNSAIDVLVVLGDDYAALTPAGQN
jgi:polyisoprenyl-teichoic acid--peptidoglycan teichoic acid transferase